MTDYQQMNSDFIRRTLRIIDQYEELVRGKVPFKNEYEVTLLMNCLLGLLIYPQQLAHHNQWQDWLTDELVIDVGDEWGISPDDVQSPGHVWEEYRTDEGVNRRRQVAIRLEELTMRNLLRQMRNTATHAHFRVSAHVSGSGQIGKIVFDDERRSMRFHVELPISSLETFVRKLALSALDNINDNGSGMPEDR